jgi:trans-aconitate 2-methyltransferase
MIGMRNDITTNGKWNAGLYDQKYDFVFKFGEDVVQLLAPQADERVLDLGCGTGYLTNLIAEAGADTIGIDSSPEMIARARSLYPMLKFEVRNAVDFSFDQPFDAIFSNAALHWILEKEKVIQSIYRNLRPGGRLVLEMGAKDNIKHIITAFKQVLQRYGYPQLAQREIWYFPSLGEYATHLEEAGLTVHYAVYFQRDTELKDNENGIRNWIQMFAGDFLKMVDQADIPRMLEEIEKILKPTNYRNNKWYADYQRLRIVAAKP